MTYEHTLNDEPTWLEKLGNTVLNKGLEVGSEAIKNADWFGGKQIQRNDEQSPQQPTQQEIEQAYQQQMQQAVANQGEGGITGIVNSMSPVVWGGIGAGLTYFLSKSAIASALVGGGLWFFTDNMKKKRPISINKIPLRS